MPKTLAEIPPFQAGVPYRKWLAEYKVQSPSRQEMEAWIAKIRQGEEELKGKKKR